MPNSGRPSGPRVVPMGTLAIPEEQRDVADACQPGPSALSQGPFVETSSAAASRLAMVPSTARNAGKRGPAWVASVGS
jgi:hypothetical protein